MEVNNDDLRLGGIIVGWLGTIAAGVWKLSKYDSRLEDAEKDIRNIKSTHFMTHADHDSIQALCRKDVDNALSNHQAALDKLCAIAERQTSDIADIKTMVAVIHGNCAPGVKK